jgi:twitching motility two-component system response regulator PilH
MAKKILVVDDSPTDNAALRALLERNGYEAIMCEGGAESVDMARQLRPDAILMDVVMPVMNGFQACKALGKDEATRSIPVVMVSNKHQEADVLWAQKQGAKGYFAKPVDESALVARLRELTSGF